MNSNEFNLLFSKLGHEYCSINKYDWLIRNKNELISTPSLNTIKVDKRYVKALFLEKQIRVASFIVDNDVKNGCEYIFEGVDYSLEKFSSKVRNQIKKGLKSVEIRNCSKSDMLKFGYEINQSTMALHDRNVDFLTNKEKWEKYIKVLFECKDVIVKGSYVNTELVAYIILIKLDSKYVIYHPFMNRAFSSLCPMNVLLYVLINDIIDIEGRIEISYGLSSTDTHQKLDHFKKGMLFFEKEISRLVIVNPKYRIFFNKITVKLLEIACKMGFLKKSMLHKFSFMMESFKIYDNLC